MIRSASINRAVLAMAAYATLGAFLLQCSNATPIGKLGESQGSGGGGQAGGNGANSDASQGGQAGDSDATVPHLNMDVLPPDLAITPEDASAPTLDSNCGNTVISTTRQPVDVLLVLDRSLSMSYSITEDCYCPSSSTMTGSVCKDTTNCSTRWDAIKSAVMATLASTDYVNWGLKFFSDSDTLNCIVTSDPKVAIAQDSGDPAAYSQAQAKARVDVQNAINTATQSPSTPTTAALNAATAYLKTLTDSNKKFILLASDGEPNCGGTPADMYTTDDARAASAAAAANAAGFPVYAIGIGPSVSSLTEVALQGGTTDYFPATSSDQLAQALSSIGKLVGSCTFTSDKAPEEPDNVAVYVNKEQVPPDSENGWKYGESNQEIELTGTYCDQMSTGDEATVQILFGCKGEVKFPPIIQ